MTYDPRQIPDWTTLMDVNLEMLKPKLTHKRMGNAARWEYEIPPNFGDPYETAPADGASKMLASQIINDYGTPAFAAWYP